MTDMNSIFIKRNTPWCHKNKISQMKKIWYLIIKSHSLSMHAKLQIVELDSYSFCNSFYLCHNLMFLSREGFSETVRLCSLLLAYTAHICNMYQTQIMFYPINAE